MSIENNKTLACQLTELLDKGDETQLNDLLSPDFVSHFAGFNQPLNREQYIMINRTAKSAFADLNRTIEDLIAEGDKVTVRITARGTHTGVFQGMVGSGKLTKISGIAIRRISDGKITEEWVVNDQLGLMQQLGAFRLPAQTKE